MDTRSSPAQSPVVIAALVPSETSLTQPIHADLTNQTTGTHTGRNSSSVHFHMEETGCDRSCNSGSKDRCDPDLRIFYNISHLEHGCTNSLGYQTAPFILRERHNCKTYHLGTAACYCCSASPVRPKAAQMAAEEIGSVRAIPTNTDTKIPIKNG